jgi:outer membrane receptor protein involved in Fe transport
MRVPGALLLLVCATTPSRAQAQQDTTRRDTVVLKPLEIIGTLSPTAAPKVGSGVPARITTISGMEIKTWEPRLLANALAGSAGVSAYDDLGSPFKVSLTSRGFTAGPAIGLPQGLSVFVDGIRQNEPDAAQVNFDLLPLEHVDHVEFLHGPAALLGPNSLGGAINLVTKRGGGPFESELETSGGSFGQASGSASVAGQVRGWAYYAGGELERQRGWRQETDGRQRNLLANVGRFGAQRGVSLQLLAASDRTREAGSLPESLYAASPKTNFTPGDFDHLSLLQGVVSGYTRLAGGRMSMSVYHRRMDGDRFNVNQIPDPNIRNENESRAVGTNIEWRGRAVRMGLDGNTRRVSVRLRAQDQATGNDSLTTWVESPGWDLAAYAVGDVELGRAAVSAGLRYDVIRIPFRNRIDPSDDTTSTFRHLSARGGVAYDLGGGSSLYASVGKSFRAPALLELSCADPAAPCPLPFALGDDPPLRPVVATTIETGIHWSRGSRVLDASLYWTGVHDDIFFVAPSTAEGYFANLESTRRAGIEIGTQSDFGTRVTLRGSYAYTRATFESAAVIATARAAADTVRRGDRFPLTPDHRLALAGTWRITRALQLDTHVNYTGRQYLRGDEANETDRLPAYWAADCRLGWRWRGWEVAALVTNVFDRRFATFGTWGTNREAGNRVERFRTPGEPRAFRFILRRELKGGGE